MAFGGEMISKNLSTESRSVFENLSDIGAKKMLASAKKSDPFHIPRWRLKSLRFPAFATAPQLTLRGCISHARIPHLMMWWKSLHLERNAVLRCEGLGDQGSM